MIENIPTFFKSNRYFRREYFLKNNKLNGTYTLWNEDGKIESEGKIIFNCY
jgi:antitoxin component YwqK of YwqJK toxin-antitoxin module